MRLLILYKKNSEHESRVIEYSKEFKYRSRLDFELIDVETTDGDSLAKLYDIVRYPAILVIADDGRLIKSWINEELPLMDEVVGYLVT